MKQSIFILVLALFVWADVVVDYAQVRNERGLGFIKIDYGSLFTPEVYQFARENGDSLRAEGVFVADTAMSHTRTDTLGEYHITTTIDFYAPRGTGYGGGNWTSNISITINGVEKVNIPFGYLALWDDLRVKSIVIQSGGRLRIDAVSGHPQRAIDIISWFNSEKGLNKKIDADLIHDLMMKNKSRNLTEEMNQEKLDSLLSQDTSAASSADRSGE